MHDEHFLYELFPIDATHAFPRLVGRLCRTVLRYVFLLKLLDELVLFHVNKVAVSILIHNLFHLLLD